MAIDRNQTLNLFLTHSHELQAQLEKVYTSYSLEVTVEGKLYRALILSHSSDYWKQRLHLHRQRPGLLIVYQHETCVPCATLALDEGYLYAPGELPHWYTPEKRFTTRGHMVLLGQLLAGQEAGYQQLASLPRSTRYRYLAQVKRFMSNRSGRPLVA
jgi:hypothetical protein